METNNTTYTFNISLSVLNHLGRNLYRNFITVLGEAISNSWDADANNVWIEVDKDSFTIKDDGIGMNDNDFRTKFLNVGYSKRKNGMKSKRGRPFIGAKGIGKLALLSCAETISIISKKSGYGYIGGVIDNSELNNAIEDNQPSSDYKLSRVDPELFKQLTTGYNQGTIVHFRKTQQSIKNTVKSVDYLKKLLALQFRFSLVDEFTKDEFNIHLNDEQVTLDALKELSDATEFLWNIGDFKDPFIDSCGLAEGALVNVDSNFIKGFIATVELPRNLKITGTDEKVGVDLFVNGRLRERDLLKHISTARYPESYIYGQIHCNELDADGKDRFTTGREGVVESDKKYGELLDEFRNLINPGILDKWDELRLIRGKKGDPENKRKTPEQRDAHSLYNSSVKKFKGRLTKKSKEWTQDLEQDAEFNIPAYADCFLSENILRKYIEEEGIDYSKFSGEIKTQKDRETDSKLKGNLNIKIRETDGDLNYLSMRELTHLVDRPGGTLNTIVQDGREYKPIRDAVAHTALLTDDAKEKLRTIYKNIRDRINKLIVKNSKTP